MYSTLKIAVLNSRVIYGEIKVRVDVDVYPGTKVLWFMTLRLILSLII